MADNARRMLDFHIERARESLDAAGAYKITGDMTKMAAQVPALFEALSGMQMSELLAKVRLIGDKKPRSDASAPPPPPPATTIPVSK